MKSQTQIVKKYLIENFSNEPFVEGFSVSHGRGTARHWMYIRILADKNLSFENWDKLRLRAYKIEEAVEKYMESINNPIDTFEMEDGYEGYCLHTSVSHK